MCCSLITQQQSASNMKVLLERTQSSCVCKVFLFWYQKNKEKSNLLFGDLDSVIAFHIQFCWRWVVQLGSSNLTELIGFVIEVHHAPRLNSSRKLCTSRRQHRKSDKISIYKVSREISSPERRSSSSQEHILYLVSPSVEQCATKIFLNDNVTAKMRWAMAFMTYRHHSMKAVFLFHSHRRSHILRDGENKN